MIKRIKGKITKNEKINKLKIVVVVEGCGNAENTSKGRFYEEFQRSPQKENTVETTIVFNNSKNQIVEMRKTFCGMCKKVRKTTPKDKEKD